MDYKKDDILYYEQNRMDPERSVDGSNFDNGEIVYKKFMSTASKINLARSYIKLTLSIGTVGAADGDDPQASLDLKSNLAPAFLASETLFKNMSYKINNVTVSDITDYIAQISSLNQRLNYSKGFRDSVLKDLNYGKPEFSERQKTMFNLVSNSGEQIERKFKPGATLSTLSVTVAGQVNGLLGTVQADLARGSIFEIYDAANSQILLYRGTIQQEIAANQWNATPRPAIAVNASVNWVRVEKVNNHRSARKLQLIFRPCLGIFQKDEWILGHEFELSLHPHSNPLWKKYFMESLISDKVPRTDYDIKVDSMIFYPCIAHISHSLEQAEYDCEFMETRMQVQNITSQSSIDRTFIVDKNTKYVTMALQSSLSSSGNTLFPRTKFKVEKNASGIDIDLDLKSYILLYDIYQFPRPQHDQQNTADINRMAQAYYENLQYSDQYKYLPDMETLDEWRKLGPYYHYKIPIRKGQSNPKLTVNTSFRDPLTDQNGGSVRPNILFFDHFKRKFKLIARNGRVVEVIPQGIQ